MMYGAAQNLIAIAALEVLYSVFCFLLQEGWQILFWKTNNQIRTSAWNPFQICPEVGKVWMLFICYPESLHVWIPAKKAFCFVFFNWLDIASSGNFLSVIIRSVLRKFPDWFLHSMEDFSWISGKKWSLLLSSSVASKMSELFQNREIDKAVTWLFPALL